jgi:predicted unusual protein kinase regulating ubiquinone biosynthesis (AarF/ABC1/UbiB family)
MGKYTLLFQTLYILLKEGLKYLLFRNYTKLVKNIVHGLYDKNMLYVKIVQSISSNENILNDELVEDLKDYTDKVPYSEAEVDRKLLEDIEQIQLLGNKKLIIDGLLPINSGMISLVFEGRIDDKHVVVKVLRKNIREKLNKAFKDLEYVVKKFSKFPKIRNFNIIDIFNENKTIIMDQLEFKKEMEYIKMFQNKWKDIDYVKIPDVYEEYTNILNDVIVMEYIDGKNIHDISEVNKEKYAYLLAKFNFKGIFFDSLYHSDLHQGNILFLNDTNNNSNNNANLKLGIIDFGIVGVMGKEEQNDYFMFFKHLVKDEYQKIVDNVVRNMVEPKTIYDDLETNNLNDMNKKLIDEFTHIRTVSKNIGAHEMYRLNKILMEYGLQLKKGFCKMELAIAVVEGICNKLSTKEGYITYMDRAYKEFLPKFMLDEF